MGPAGWVWLGQSRAGISSRLRLRQGIKAALPDMSGTMVCDGLKRPPARAVGAGGLSPADAPAVQARCHGDGDRVEANEGQARRSVSVSLVPCPGWLLAVSSPPCARASSAAIARPIPLPEVCAAP